MENYGFITMENYGVFLLGGWFVVSIIGWYALKAWNSHVEEKIKKELDELEAKPFGLYLAALEETAMYDTLGIDKLNEEQRRSLEDWLLK